MKFLRLLLLFAATVASLPAADDPVIAAVRAADDERLAAIIAADPVRLDAILSPALHYGHSNGKADDKASFVRSLTSRAIVYESFDYQERTFTPAGPDAVLMRGRVLTQVVSGGQKIALDLTFLAVWRLERGAWRFLAWQSSRNPPPPANP